MTTRLTRTVRIAAVAAFLSGAAVPAAETDTAPAGSGAGEAAASAFTPEFLNDPENIELGRKLWNKRCKFCHGKRAYPGKAPKLKPRRYTPDFVYRRVTNGFRGMPSWSHEFDEHERRSIAAYVMSKKFSN